MTARKKKEDVPEVKKISAADLDRATVLMAWPAHVKMEHPVQMKQLEEAVIVVTAEGEMQGHPGDWLCFDERSGHLWVVNDEYKRMHYKRT